MLRSLTPNLLLIALMMSCAQEKKYDEVSKTADLQFATAFQSKSTLLEMCTTDDPCVYLPSVANTPYAVDASRPFWQGEQKLVVSNMVKGKLQLLQVENDERFQGNINNLSPVLNIAVDHIDYKCKEDDYGDCTNKEEVDKDKPWDQRKYVQVTDVEVVEKNSLPIEFSELFQSGCFTEVGKSAEKLEVEKDALNIIVKKAYEAKAGCLPLQEMNDLRYLNFTVDYTYSIVKLSSLVDKDYPVAEFPVFDKETFGFFTTEIKKKTVDNHDHVMGIRQTFMNRWSPNKKEVVYKLNSAFYEAQNKAILDATIDAIKTVNLSLKKANAGFQITLERGQDSKIGDLRENFIILVKDPQASGVIGYGPSVTNPKTGEIFNARTVMYYGTIQKFVSRAYDELVDEAIANQQLAQAKAQAQAQQKPMVSYDTDKVVTLTSDQRSMIAASAGHDLVQIDTRSFEKVAADEINRLNNFFVTRIDDSVLASMSKESREEELRSRIQEELRGGIPSFEKKIAKMAKNTFFHGSNMNFDGAVLEALASKLQNKEQLKYWIDLTEEQRAEVMKQLVPYVWVPTLVHEFGHNLGLRHNFNGSTDKDNYYSEEEAKSLGMRKAVTYSSIMDYAPKTNNELFVMGKYDVAALRFAYAREVETKSGEFVKIPKKQLTLDSGETVAAEMTLRDFVNTDSPVELKDYMFCTDEDVPYSSLCNRFDDGTNYQEVLQTYIDRYKDNYEKINFRRRSYDFESRYGDSSYFNRTLSTFFNIRNFFEMYDQMKFRGSYDNEELASKDEFLTDVKKAADMSFDFFMDILETPSYHCAKFTLNEQNQIEDIDIKPFAQMVKGTELAGFGITFDIKDGCYFLQNPAYNSNVKPNEVYGSFGKYINNSIAFDYDKSQARQNDSSQIDIRGIWMDKVLATYITTARFTSPTNYGTSAAGIYMDYDEYKPRMQKVIDGFLKNSLESDVVVTLPNGFEVPLGKMNLEVETSHKINKSYNWYINAIFGLDKSRTSLKSAMFSWLKPNLATLKDEASIEDGQAYEDFYIYDVDKVSTRVDLDRYNYDKVVEFKNSQGVTNHRFGLYNYNLKAIELAKVKSDLELLKIAGKQISNIAYAVASRDDLSIDVLVASGEFSDEEISDIKDAMSVGIDTLRGHYDGTLTDQVILSAFIALSK